MKIKQQGVILIAVLWIISISLVFISVLAKNTRLSATIVMHQQQSLDDWSRMLSLINLVKMEVLVRHKKNSAFGQVKKDSKEEDKIKTYFYGNKFELSFPGYEDMVVRIYDLSGKMNISNMNKSRFKKLLNHQGVEEKLVDGLLDAWQDWIDKDDLKRLNGAEKEYYRKQNPPYAPRNGPLQSVNELALIKGFEQAFENYDYTQAFTLYGVKRPQVNPNIANKATLLLIPDMTEEFADKIISHRQQSPFSNMAEFNELIPANIASNVRGWFVLSKSKSYAIVIYSKQTEKDAIIKEDGSTEIYVYKEIIEFTSKNKKPQTLRVFPSYKIRIPAISTE